MGTREFRIVPVLVVAVVASSAAGPPLPATTTGEDRGRRIPARVIEGGLLALPVTVNGTGPHAFLLDTGATSSIVDDDLARELGLADVGQANQVSPNGARSVRLARATLKLGSVDWEGDVLRTKLVAVRAIDGAIRGIVGQDVLRLANWWIDYRLGVVRLEGVALLDKPAVKALLRAAIRQGKTPLPANGRGYTVVKSVSAKQRPRRPA